MGSSLGDLRKNITLEQSPFFSNLKSDRSFNIEYEDRIQILTRISMTISNTHDIRYLSYIYLMKL